jgi:hypothetical protein
MDKQARIIITCMTLYNFITDSHLNDDLFDMCDEDEDFDPSDQNATSSHLELYGQEDGDMNALRDSIADDLITIYQ